jgi:hypothetical protein
VAERFDTLLEALAGVAAAQVVVIETLHEHRLLDKRHFARSIRFRPSCAAA